MAQADQPDDLPDQGGGYLARLLDALSAEGRERFREMAKTRVAAPRTVLIADGEEASEIGFVLSGTLAMTKLLPDGRAHIIGLLVPTEMYGRLFSGVHRHQIEALSEARLLCLRRAAFETLLSQEPGAERLLLAHALDELDMAREWVLLLNGTRVVNRVASFLVILLRRNLGQPAPARQPLTVQVHLSRADLAAYLGTRPETLSRAFHDLADRSVLRILDPYRFEILDLPALLEVSGQDLLAPGPC